MQDERAPLTEEEIATLPEIQVEVRLAKSHVLSIRLSDQELRALAYEARRVGITTGALIKRAALDAAEMHRFSAPTPVSFGLKTRALAWWHGPTADAPVTGGATPQTVSGVPVPLTAGGFSAKDVRR